MQTSYIYTATHATTLAQNLLTEADVGRLLACSTPAEQVHALKESYLAPYVNDNAEDPIAEACAAHLVDVKRLALGAAPQPNTLAFLWLRHDFNNLRVFARARRLEWSYTETVALFSDQAYYSTEQFYEHAVNNTLNRLEPELHDAYQRTYRQLEADDVAAADRTIDAAYLACATRYASASKDPFVQRLVARTIDIYNVQARLRTAANPTLAEFDHLFVSGGQLRRDEMTDADRTLANLAQLGGEAFWREAIEDYHRTGHTTALDARFDDYLLQEAMTASYDIFSVASIVAYVLRARQSAAIVRTITVGTKSGVDAATIQSQLRNTYASHR